MGSGERGEAERKVDSRELGEGRGENRQGREKSGDPEWEERGDGEGRGEGRLQSGERRVECRGVEWSGVGWSSGLEWTEWSREE